MLFSLRSNLLPEMKLGQDDMSGNVSEENDPNYNCDNMDNFDVESNGMQV